MFDKGKFELAKKTYKDNFRINWPKEKYKWVAIKHFQDNWDVEADDFVKMFDVSTEKTSNLLGSSYYFPKGMIKKFGEADPDKVKEMFINLYDETQDLKARVSNFISDSDFMKEKYGDNSWNNHYQNTSSISTYLWLRYPDKYYMFKYGEQKSTADKIGSSYKPKAGGSPESLLRGYDFYDAIREELAQDRELVSLFVESLTEECYSDNNLITLTGDFAYFVTKYFDEWEPIGYTPNISEKKWIELLKDQTIFYKESLEIMKRFKDNNEMGTCTELANKYGELKNFYNVGSSSLAQRVAKKTNCNVMEDENGKKRWWPILYKGRPASEEVDGSYTWKLRKELSNALDKVNLSTVKLYADSTTWCIAANTEKYNVVDAFKNLSKLNWSQSTNIKIGDIVYIYLSKPTQAIKYKCIVNKVDLKRQEIDDSRYYLDEGLNINQNRYMELELIDEFLGTGFNFEYLSNHEFVVPQGPLKLKPETIHYLELLEKLRSFDEMDPDSHDGSYELVRETIRAYSKMEDLSICDFNDLNLVYLMSIGTWRHGIPRKRETIERSNLSITEKERLNEVLTKVWEKTKQKTYSNHKGTKPLIGMFGTGFYSFKGKTDNTSPQKFIKMCLDITDYNEDEDVFRRCELVLDNEFKGMAAASASVVLHCLKPMTFPIFNSNMGSDNIYVYLGIPLKDTKAISTYINNCRNVKEFRDDNFKIKNYRIFDIAAWNIGKKLIKENVVEDEIMLEPKISFPKNLILSGPPGTGKTYMSKIYAVAMCDNKDVDALYEKETYETIVNRYIELEKMERVVFTTFHQSYSYEEFIEGIKPIIDEETKDITYKIEAGLFKEFCKKANKDKDNPYVFIIDEVNRGNISKIFGELITLIEDTKRYGQLEATTAILPYSKESFTVPDNVYILGTMNTADRSIAFMDTALRRRFKFIEMMPDLNVLRELGADRVGELDIPDMLEIINNRITFLYDREHTIGHSFFTSLQGDKATIENLSEIFKKSIIPLLQEYFYEDFAKIQLILGDNDKSQDDYKFISEKKVVAGKVFKGGVEDIDLPDKTYSINEKAFVNIQSYTEISNE